MHGGASRVCLLATVAILLTVLYPALFLDCRLAPEASLKSVPPWRELLGPLPKPAAEAFAAATRLGPRLSSVARNPFGEALWNPWIGGGRPGWLSGPEDGGTPLVLVAALAARPGWAWTALFALEAAAALMGAWWVLRLLRLDPWPAAVGATAYALSGAVTAHWLDWQGSALALGPLALAPALAQIRSRRSLVVAWAISLGVLAACGPAAMPYVALAAAAMLFLSPEAPTPARWLAVVAAAVLVLVASLPRIWLDLNGREAGAAVSLPQAMPAIGSLKSMIATADTADPATSGTSETASPGGLAYLGLGTAALALVGLVSAPAKARGFWLGVAGVSALVASVPNALLTKLGLWQRPYGVLAFAAAALAAYGVQFLTDRLAEGRGRTVLGASVWALIAVSLLPHAAVHLPFVSREESELTPPIPKSMVTTEWRLLGLLGTMPPDSAASLGLADVRASSFRGEPRYSSLLASGKGGEVSLSRALDPRIVRLGARWLLEPLPLRVVSGEVFSRIDITELELPKPLPSEGVLHLRAEVPAGACRLGLPSALGRSVRARIQLPDRDAELSPDETLQAESAAWAWFELPEDLPPGPATLLITPDRGRAANPIPVAWDRSGLRVARQQGGVRIWEWMTARPLAVLAGGIGPESAPLPPDPYFVTVPGARVAALLPLSTARAAGKIRIAAVRPGRVEVRADLETPGLLVVQVKHRPQLFRATVDGRPVATERVDGVWTGIALPRGSSRAVLEAELPPALWWAAGAALAAIVLLAASRRFR